MKKYELLATDGRARRGRFHDTAWRNRDPRVYECRNGGSN